MSREPHDHVPAGFDEAFDPLFGRAAIVARRIVADDTVAEDVAAESMARAYAHWGRIGGRDWREGWVVRVATNLAIDTVRKRSRRGERSVDEALDAGAQLPDPAASSDGGSDEVVERLDLVAAVGRLPRRQREAVSLHHLAGLPVSEVAEAMRVSPGSVKTHLHRGVARLRERIGPDVFGAEPVDEGGVAHV